MDAGYIEVGGLTTTYVLLMAIVGPVLARFADSLATRGSGGRRRRPPGGASGPLNGAGAACSRALPIRARCAMAPRTPGDGYSAT